MTFWDPNTLCFCSLSGPDSICRCGALRFIDELQAEDSMSLEYGQADPPDSGLGCNTPVVYCPMEELPSTPSHSLSFAATLPVCPKTVTQRFNHEQPTPSSSPSRCFTLPSLYTAQIKCSKEDLCIKCQKILDWGKKKRLIIPQRKRVNDVASPPHGVREAGGREIQPINSLFKCPQTPDPIFQYFAPHLQPSGSSKNVVVDETLGMSCHDTGSVMESNSSELNALAVHCSPGLYHFLQNDPYSPPTLLEYEMKTEPSLPSVLGDTNDCQLQHVTPSDVMGG